MSNLSGKSTTQARMRDAPAKGSTSQAITGHAATGPAVATLAGNRLSTSKSPYLLQHADNPVHWHPWGDEALQRARDEDRPLFVSIGYSTCHWCHVMAHESFEDDEVARLLNDAFVCVKVDREERPDIDAAYMAACQILTGTGGWPLTIIALPDGRPFFAATYLPKHSRPGRIGLMDLVPRVLEVWRHKRDDVLDSADSIVEHVRRHAEALLRPPSDGRLPGAGTLHAACEAMVSEFDAANGGFGTAPKFPSPHNLLFLLRWARRNGHAAGQPGQAQAGAIPTGEEPGGAKALRMAAQTLRAIRRGGIHDHVGYGFHRYSTDARWLLPHFEKMLYDQAMLMLAYAEAWLATGDGEFRRTAEETAAYVLRDLTSSEGAFYSAEDADSELDGAHGEGLFYTFTLADIEKACGPLDVGPEVRADASPAMGTHAGPSGDGDGRGGAARANGAGPAYVSDADLAARAFGCTAYGNYEDEATRSRTGRNILHLPRAPRELARDLGLPPREVEERLEAARAALFDLRARRPRPHLDDKVLADWNGLAIAAMSRCAQAFDAPHLAEAAAAAADFVLSRMATPEGRLLHRWRDGEAAVPGLLDDYAFMIWGLIELYGATGEVRWLRRALRLQEVQDTFFHDAEGGGYWMTPADGDALLVRRKEGHDGALPSGNAAALFNLLRLALLLGRPEYGERARGVLRAFATQVRHHPIGSTMFLCGVDFALGGGRSVIVAGEPDQPDTEAMLAAVRGTYAPTTVLHLRTTDNARDLAALVPFTAHLAPLEDRATVWLCENYACSPPITDPAELKARLLAVRPLAQG
ncbi:thioredoxin domain-containing protein [Nitratidesulfovibrio liaohensis]|uniref:Thioredoxin domain-containing protein n=1 Tax=Nitratidesulfovibrio liaohensis TaxID=2604158 RepID=A0ABY9R0V1_9BACT|nr:thioredoxin domain-containing protein [Nitratidesulfovibrio liaohensis]WMW65089.1 thioredoxin domain-containing protein [Nitratidesulfovibrio liaohensis]